MRARKKTLLFSLRCEHIQKHVFSSLLDRCAADQLRGRNIRLVDNLGRTPHVSSFLSRRRAELNTLQKTIRCHVGAVFLDLQDFCFKGNNMKTSSKVPLRLVYR